MCMCGVVVGFFISVPSLASVLIIRFQYCLSVCVLFIYVNCVWYIILCIISVISSLSR